MDLGDMVLSRRIRQNHALEHATITVLTRQMPGLAVSARSTTRGFTIFADLDLDAVRRGCDEALARLRQGEDHLAIHPNCGTNLAVGTSLAMMGWLFALSVLRPRARVASVLMGSFAGYFAARPLGGVVQRHVTTLADVADVRIVTVQPRRLFGRRVVDVITTANSHRN